jgi:two-component system, sensor histidine kinase and response regulator
MPQQDTVQRTQEAARVARSIETSNRLQPRRASVLVVEDNDVNRQVAHAMLTQLDCDVTLAEEGTAGVALALTHRFDLVLMDCQMPLVDGYESTQRIRAQQPIAERTPIVALTANALHGDRERCLAAGMDDYLAKPFSRSALKVILDRWVPVDSGAGAETGRSTSPARDTACIDGQALAEVQAIDHDGTLVSGIIALYQQDGADLLRAIRVAYEHDDIAALAFAAHTLKSSSGCIGARDVLSLCATVETRARASGERCTAAELIALEDAFHASCVALSGYLQPDVMP